VKESQRVFIVCPRIGDKSPESVVYEVQVVVHEKDELATISLGLVNSLVPAPG
jgi:hypothetical protein